ncbi:MAG TPA: carbohydrate-binding family 9-like protein, partial [Polyangia bacterium]|nr:carbohydrate-binding family 9-like protein [Polyangia bacterium]
ELMIDADGNGRTYIELQVAPNGNIFDTYLPTVRRYEDTVDPQMKPFSWNSKLVAKVHVDGTLNKRDDKDTGWTAELALPLEDVKGMDASSAVRLPPQPGDVWRINMYRMDQPKGKPQQAAGWSPPMVGDFHALSRFGELVFADADGKTTPPAAPPPPPAKVAAAKAGSKREKK